MTYQIDFIVHLWTRDVAAFWEHGPWLHFYFYFGKRYILLLDN